MYLGDGCVSQVQRTYQLVIACDAGYVDVLGIRWTQSNPRNISVAHRHSVARLDSFVPLKS